MSYSSENLKNALFNYFGYKDFKYAQEEIIHSVFEGNDTLAIMPTGGGKSLCYQLPALISDGTVIVISPLIALMKDQVDALAKASIPAAFINSSLSQPEIDFRLSAAEKGSFRLLYVAPERLESKRFIESLKRIKIAFFAVDEAHCISEWGHDFRPSYLSISGALVQLKKVQILALTATATPEVQDDIVRYLKLKNIKKFISGFRRDNLIYKTIKTDKRIELISNLCNNQKSGSIIIYCGSRKKVEELAEGLRKEKIESIIYHAGMDAAKRKTAQELFISDKCKIIIATNAFGMGIDKPDVRKVIHYDLTSSVESYYQESGRAGRDGMEAECILLWNPDDKKLQEYFINTNYPDKRAIERVYDTIYNYLSTEIGEIPQEPLFADDVQIAGRVGLPTNIVSSVLKLFEREGILRKGVANGLASLKFTANYERVKEYYSQTNPSRKKILELLLRFTGGSAFVQPVEFDLNEMLLKYNISLQEFNTEIYPLTLARIVEYQSPGITSGLMFLKERQPIKQLFIDFKKLSERRKIAIRKLDLMLDYASTEKCKQNFILEYFKDENIIEDCHKCSSCQSQNLKTNKKQIVEKNELLKFILLAAGELNYRFGANTIADLIKGNKTKRINQYSLFEAESFGLAKNYSLIEIKEKINEALKNEFIKSGTEIYSTISITKKGIEEIGKIPNIFSFDLKTVDASLQNQLYKNLVDLRKEIARSSGIMERAVVSDRTMRKIAAAMPQKLEEFDFIDGIGQIFKEHYGQFFIDAIRKFNILSEISESPKPDSLSLQAEQTLEYINENFSAEQTAKIRKIAVKDVYNHIIEAVEKELITNIENYFEPQIYSEIKIILNNEPFLTSRSLREKLKVRLDYSLIKLACAASRKKIL